MKSDNFYMLRALELARKAEGNTSPNPAVGCVIVKNRKIIGEGYHKKAGLPHAEIEALKRCRDAESATMYVTLEPCDHYGKTPPCTEEIIRRGIKKVVIAIKDPNHINNGRGIRKLRQNRILVKSGICLKEAHEFYKPYIKFITKDQPFVTLKIAESLDGKIATKRFESKWITNSLSRSYAKKLRAKVDAVMVGINTVLKDDPLLFANDRNMQKKRIIVDPHLKIPLDSRLVKSIKQAPLIIVATNMAPQNKLNALKRKGAAIIKANAKNDKVDIKKLFKILAGAGITHILAEGGGTLTGSLFDAKAVDRVLFFISPKIIGGEKAVSSVRGNGIARLKDAIKLKNIRMKRFGEDVLIEGDIN